MGRRASWGGAACAILLLAAPARAWTHRVCPDCEDIPWAWDDGRPFVPDNPPLPEGFVLTYAIRPGDGGRASRPLTRFAEVGDALAGCWAATATTKPWREVTLRLSFRRNGSINGVPRIQHLDAPGDAAALAALRTSFLSTVNGCTPLPFSPTLGAAIAGQIFAIRFIQQKDNDHG